MRLPGVRLSVRQGMTAIAGLALVFGGVTCGFRRAENRLVVENRSGQSLDLLDISLSRAGHIVTIKSLPDGGAETAPFWIKGDDGFVLNGSLADGTKVVGNFGYVTNGDYAERLRFVVRPGGRVEFTD
ncbi:hypothetical protein SAMN05444166_6488 [Singulisphaera sp. GP187]|uniref:hypothetical protein n=1 Tax=Singulisphaera sp. GP187 TaxID=1882752 RepID=UPI00092C8528|nr:hypothetical protein [Singulisphaera sp. GP187]SIO60691.1 hypothetical protein SAMN05444166_6488 [Singulisphaera sp. GP187]